MNCDNQLKTPLFDAMVALAESRKISFHTPGHKSGKGISTRFRKYVGPRIFSIDLTTLDEVDSLQSPMGVIKEAQKLAAIAYGADHSFFQLNGTTGGIHAMILAACGPGDDVLVARNAHRSVIAGLLFSGARPIFFSPEISQDLKVQMNVSARETRAVIDAHPEARVLILTSPNYYGIVADLKNIIAYAHQKGLIVLVDEAHGPHLHFHPSFPVSAMAAGADVSVQSTHKIIGGMTQASMLHANDGGIGISRIKSVLRLNQSTSPSYILMASLDLARMQMATEGEKLLVKAIRLAEESRQKINEIPGFSCFGREALRDNVEGIPWDLDVTKLTISVAGLGLSGFEVSEILNKRYQIQVEMADPVNILVIVSIGDRQDDLDRLLQALHVISNKYYVRKTGQDPLVKIDLPDGTEKSEMLPREAFFKPQKFIPLSDASGMLSSQIVTVYPPGIPVLIPGEVITGEIITYLKRMTAVGAIVDGLDEDHGIGVVVKNNTVFDPPRCERIPAFDEN